VTARMFVQDIEVLRKTANRSIIDRVTARDLEALARLNKIGQIVERAFKEARRVAQRINSAVQRRHELIGELRLGKRRIQTQRLAQDQKRGHIMSPV
jgi:hypothetical protein